MKQDEFRKVSTKQFPPKAGWYDTDQGNLFWYESERNWSCRDDRLSEEYPAFWYEPLLSKQPSSLSTDEEIENTPLKQFLEAFKLIDDSEPLKKDAIIWAITKKFIPLEQEWLRNNSKQPSGVSEIKWYSESEMFDWLIKRKYSKEIANELSGLWAKDLQSSFDKGYEKAKRELLKTPMSESLSPQSDAVEFLEWVAGKNYHQLKGGVCFRQAESEGIEQLTPQELFTQYLKEKRR